MGGNRRKIGLCAMGVLLLCTSISFSCAPEETPHANLFEATTRFIYLIDDDVITTHEGIAAVGESKLRYETFSHYEAHPTTIITIIREDLHRTYLVIPSTRRFVVFASETAIDGMNVSPFDSSSGDVARTTMGEETINGYHTTKYMAKETYLDGSSAYYFEWMLNDREYFPIRAQYPIKDGDSIHTIVWELTDIRWGEPAEELFELPAGYNPADNLMEALKGESPPPSKNKGIE
jgi:hypothetical protein